MPGTNPTISFQSHDYLIVNKAPGVLSQKADNGESGVQEALTTDYSHGHMLTRLDRPVSGLMIYSLSSKFHKHYLHQQKNGKVVKQYLAIVEGKVNSSESEYIKATHYHVHDHKRKRAQISSNVIDGDRIDLEYRVLHRLDNYTVLVVRLYQGKFHQIRAQLSFLGHPIKGDVKYGARRRNPTRHIHLHAFQLTFQGRDNETITHKVSLPSDDTLWTIVNTNLESIKD